jgi:hypothetical protein
LGAIDALLLAADLRVLSSVTSLNVASNKFNRMLCEEGWAYRECGDGEWRYFDLEVHSHLYRGY